MDSKTAKFLELVAKEIDFARSKYPEPDATMVALVSEVGELAQAILTQSTYQVESQAVQVAALAARLVVDGDKSIVRVRKKRGLL